MHAIFLVSLAKGHFFVCFQCKPEYKVPGLYVIDSIVRQSRHQFGTDKDVFGPRFSKNITATFQYLYLCPSEDKVQLWFLVLLWIDKCSCGIYIYMKANSVILYVLVVTIMWDGKTWQERLSMVIVKWKF